MLIARQSVAMMRASIVFRPTRLAAPTRCAPSKIRYRRRLPVCLITKIAGGFFPSRSMATKACTACGLLHASGSIWLSGIALAFSACVFSECGLRGLVSSLFDESPRAPFRSSPDREPEPSKRRTSRRRRVHALAAHPVVEIRALVADNAGELSERRTTAPAMAGDF